MTRYLFILLCLAFAKANAQRSTVFIDEVNAPENPYEPYASEKLYSLKKGNIYSIDKQIFDRNGNLLNYLNNITNDRAEAKEKN